MSTETMTGPAAAGAAGSTMRRVVVSADGIEVTRHQVPVLRPGEVLVRSVVTGVCGSDAHAAAGRHPFVPLPYHPGHEVVGVVERSAGDVTGWTTGQRVTVEPDLPCWHCKMCTTGRENLCENLTFFGCGYEQGGMADWFTVPARRLHVVPDHMDLTTAALIEPLSTPVHAVRIAGDVRGKAVVVLGAGTIGLLVLAVLRAHGARAVVVTDVLEAKRQRAARLGADATVDATAPDAVAAIRQALGESADVVFDCVSSQPTVDQAVALADRGGTVVVVGVPTRPLTLPLPIIQDHQIRIQGSATYLPEDYAESIRLLSSGAVRAADVVTDVLPLERVSEAFAMCASGDHGKVLVHLDETTSLT